MSKVVCMKSLLYVGENRYRGKFMFICANVLFWRKGTHDSHDCLRIWKCWIRSRKPVWQVFYFRGHSPTSSCFLIMSLNIQLNILSFLFWLLGLNVFRFDRDTDEGNHLKFHIFDHRAASRSKRLILLCGHCWVPDPNMYLPRKKSKMPFELTHQNFFALTSITIKMAMVGPFCINFRGWLVVVVVVPHSWNAWWSRHCLYN